MKKPTKEILVKIFIVMSFIICALSFEILYSNAEFVRAVIHSTELSYNFSLFRIIVYVTILIALILNLKKISKYIVENIERKPIAYVIAEIIFGFSVILGAIYVIRHVQDIQSVGIFIMAFFMISFFILYLGKSTTKNMLAFGITFGILFSITNVFNHPMDERQHFISALNVSFGNFNFSNPVTDEEFQKWEQVLKYDKLEENSYETYHVQKTDDVDEEVKPTDYHSFLYIPASIGILVAKVLQGTMIDVYIAGRIANLLFYLLLAIITLKVLPFKKNLFACILVNPLLLALSASYSMDGMCAVLVMLFTAYVLKMFKEQDIGIKQILILILLFGLVLTQKGMAYAPIAIILLILPIIKIIKQNKKYLPYFIIALVVLIIGGIIILSNMSITADSRGGNTNSSAQIQNIVENPKHLLNVYFNHTIEHLLNFGWMLQLNQPALFGIFAEAAFIMLTIFYVCVAIVDDSYNFKIKEKTIFIITYLIGVFITSLGLYISFTEVGEPNIEGYQGRYLFPILALPLMCFSTNNIKVVDKEWSSFKIMLVLALITVIDLIGMIAIYMF